MVAQSSKFNGFSQVASLQLFLTVFKTKICGIKSPETATFCSSVGVGAIGLNFFETSKRFVSVSAARQILDALDAKGSAVQSVGLFVNHAPGEIARIQEILQLDFIQLHGNETPDFLATLSTSLTSTNSKIIRAIRLSKTNENEAIQQIQEWETHSNADRLAAFLLDAYVPNEFGGTGQSIDWNWLRSLNLPTDKPIILAGGLTPQNVYEAIQRANPIAVDVAGGVENNDHIKDTEMIREFVENANRSFDRV